MADINDSRSGKTGFWHRFWGGVQIAQVRLRFIVLMVLVGVVAGNWEGIMNRYDRWRRPGAAGESADLTEVANTGGKSSPSGAMETVKAIEYYCPMHPNVVRDEPGNCPICGMPLSKREKAAAVGQAGMGGESHVGVLGQVTLTPQKMAMGRIGVSAVGYQLLSREIRTVGIVDYDETRRAFISSRVKGRLDKLMVNYTGQQVKQGDPLASIYSPELVVAQEDLLLATRDLDQQRGQAGEKAAQSMADSARQKLRLWGITDEQIEQIVRRGSSETHLTIYSPIAGIVTEKNVLEGRYVNEGDSLYTIADMSAVWLQVQVFEDEVKGVQAGTAVEVTSTAYPNEIFAGRIDFVSYTVNAATRTVAARVEVANPEYKLKPGMYARAVIRLPVGTVTEAGAISSTAGVAPTTESSESHEAGDQPASKTAAEPAAGAGSKADERFVTGYYCPIYPDRIFDEAQTCPIDKFPIKRMTIEKVLAVPETAVVNTGMRKIVYRQGEAGVFEMVEVTLGPRAGEYYPVLAGLNAGDEVATAGSFLVDAENRLNPAASAKYFGASGGPSSVPPAGQHEHHH